MTYTVKNGETITDVCFNAAGSILAWEAILSANNFTDWTPDLQVGQVLQIPQVVDSFALSVLQQSPVNNALEVGGFDDLVNEFITLFPSAVSIFALPEAQSQQINLYTVKQGETITDVVFNATGNLLNWSLILDANGFTDWTPELYAGQQIIIPSTVDLQLNVMYELAKFPINNDSGLPDLDVLITNFISNFTRTKIFTADSTLLTMDETDITADYL